jgi:hypothetical protein
MIEIDGYYFISLNLKNMNAIGKTPLLKLERMAEPGSAEIYVKYGGQSYREHERPHSALDDRRYGQQKKLNILDWRR